MQIRTFYTIAILLPFAGLVPVVALGGDGHDLTSGLPPGATAEWLYPRSSIRGLAAYGLVALWLLLELRRRTTAEFARMLWRAPVVNAAANILLLAPFTLVEGAVREMLSDEGGRLALRLLVRLVVGFAYVGLVAFVREQFRQSSVLQADD
jgi:hypothetical protein